MALNNATEIASIRARLEELDAERDSLTARLERMTSQPGPDANSKPDASVTVASAAAEKITLFRRLFAGRTEVFPVRWENRNTGKSGYAPACANEWVRGVCGKPQVKCGECPNQAFNLYRDLSSKLGSRCARAVSIWQGWPRLDLFFAADSSQRCTPVRCHLIDGNAATSTRSGIRVLRSNVPQPGHLA
jgi:hypothetical protein